MWTIIKRCDDALYDLVPNNWLIDTNTSFYPNVGLIKTKQYAKQGTLPDSDTWDKLEIEIIKRNIGKFTQFIQ